MMDRKLLSLRVDIRKEHKRKTRRDDKRISMLDCELVDPTMGSHFSEVNEH